MRFAVVAVGLSFPSVVGACEGSPDCDCDEARVAEVAPAPKDPAVCATKADLIGSNCSYSTGVMAQRVLAEGNAYTYTGSLQTSDNALASRVASPYTVGPDGAIHVVANEVVEALSSEAAIPDARLQLEGKLLEVDGIKYLVVTTYAADPPKTATGS